MENSLDATIESNNEDDQNKPSNDDSKENSKRQAQDADTVLQWYFSIYIVSFNKDITEFLLTSDPGFIQFFVFS